MTDAECIALLQWLLPRLHLRWAGFRRVRRQVCKRFHRRINDLGLADAHAYRDYLCRNPEEAQVADYLCRVTISRFYRDHGVFERLNGPVLDSVCADKTAANDRQVHIWSAGCASGEETYSIALAWHFAGRHRWPGIQLRILGTDIDDVLLERARQGCYAPGTLKELPPQWQEEGFRSKEGSLCLKPGIMQYVSFVKHDLRSGAPECDFDVVLCRNLAFTYFDDELQDAAADTIHEALADGGFLVLGKHEVLPAPVSGFQLCYGPDCIYRKCP